jgi:hypothetical protein
MATGKTPCGIAIPQTSAPADVRFLCDYSCARKRNAPFGLVAKIVRF